MASTYIHRTQGTGTLRTKCTLSVWLKKTSVSSGAYHFFVSSYNSGSDRMGFYFNTDDTLSVYSPNWNLHTNRKFRDVNAWYHIVYRIDTTHGNTSDRVRLYVNGEQITNFGTANYPTQNYNLEFGTSSYSMKVGNYDGSQYYFDGIMSHVHFLDGEDRDASYFGETDATTGQWKIKTNVTGVNYGNQGFFLFKNDNALTDHSGNSNNFTSGGGTLTKSQDCPSNVFCTANILSKGADTALSLGNTKARNDTGNNSNTLGTLAFGNGKYYWEGYRHGGGNIGIGICLASVDGATHSSVEAGRVMYYENGTIFCNGLSDQSNITTGVTYSDTDIISVSMDTENGILKFYKNDTLVTNSTITNTKLTHAENLWVPHTYQNNGGEWRLNFGNGYFGTTAVSSAGTNASNNGIFEYNVPTGFTALSTKGLNL